MNAGVLASVAAIGSLLATRPLEAQVRVVGDVVVAAGPVSARVIIGNPYPNDVYVYRYPARRIVYAPRIIVVERYHPSYRGQRFGYYRHQGYREVRAWYDFRHHTYYDGYRPGMRAVVLYERGGRYYQNCDDGRYQDRDRDHGSYDDRRYDDRRYDDD